MHYKTHAVIELFEAFSNNFLLGEIFQQLLIFLLTLIIATSLSKSLARISFYHQEAAQIKGFENLKNNERDGEKLMYMYDACKKQA